MDETRSVRHYTRRLALAAVICCGVTQAKATEPSTLSGLLNQGWSTSQVADSDGSQELRLPTVPTLVRPAPTPIDVPPVLTPAEVVKRASSVGAETSTSKSRVFDAPIVGPSLARLIQTRTERTEAPIRFDTEGIRHDLAPSVNRVDVERQATLALEQDAMPPKPRVTVATPFVASVSDPSYTVTEASRAKQAQDPAVFAMPVLSAGNDDEQEPERNVVNADQSVTETATASAAKQPSSIVESTSDASNGPIERQEAESSMASLLQEFASPVPRKVKDPSSETFAAKAVVSEMATQAQTLETKVLEDQTPKPRSSVAKIPTTHELPDLPAPAADVSTDHETIASMSTPSESQVNSLGTAEEKLTQLPMPQHDVSLPISQLSRQHSLTNQPTMGSVQATRLRKLAQESLQTAYDRAARGANHSAKKYATEALRLAVATRDAMEGGNQNTLALNAAFDAIRESEDFCGRYGPANPNALGRMIVSHQTTVLKQSNPGTLSAYEAADAYLSFARERLTRAGGMMPEASHALVLLGRLEKRVSQSGRTYCDAVSVTLHRSAIDIEPANAAAHCALGTTLLEQGLTEQASLALRRSVEISPTRAAYKGLLEVARRSGDAVAARACNAALTHPALGNDLPVMRLDVESFAQTHRPNQIQPRSVEETSPAAGSQAQAPRVGLRSLFPFTRR